MKNFNSNTKVFFCFFAVSLSVKIILLAVFRFDGFYGQDSYAYFDNSKLFISSISKMEMPPNFYFPIGFCLLTSIINIFTSGNTALASLLVSLITSSLIPGMTFLLSYEITINKYEKENARLISVISGIIMCFNASLIKSGIVVMSDSAGLLFAVSSVYYLVRYRNKNKFSSLIFSFSFLVLSVMMRYAYLILIVIFVLFFISEIISDRIKVNKLHLFVSIILAFIIFSPQLFYILKYGIAYFRKEEGPGGWAVQWSIFNFFRKEFFIADGTFRYKIWNSIYYPASVFHPMNFSIFGLTFISGIYFLVRKKYIRLFSVLLIWIIVYYVYLSGNPLQIPRYSLSIFPAIAIICSTGYFELGIKRIYKRIFLVMSLIFMFGFGIYQIAAFVRQKNEDLKVANYANNIKPDSILFSFYITGTINHYSEKKSLEFYRYNEELIKSTIDTSRTDLYFILPDSIITNQWKGLTLEKTYSYVKKNYKLDKVFNINMYSIYCIKKS